ncbi:MAG TPA: hypothetical protein VFS71_17730 [Flavobacterium sp.]|uniref:hypothetical protein n=1 Tax=Flavobacterium sp. TaxID=239 RepID=UPI002DBA43C3|nr:hypothetical protein [Flavobacterium sp.]HEU4791533.1 hypothetical protein [Flavobacterium sp.]
MKKLILGIILLFAIMGCSSKRDYVYSGKCTICGKETNWSSIGLCNKHYTLEKEHKLRGLN